jgi:RNA polymerase sigma-70 factor (ECF subfamily)
MAAPGEAAERHAFDRAFREAEPFLRAVARRLCRNTSDCDDLVQDTFERALRASGAPPVNSRAWLAAILQNLFIDRCRAVGRRPIHEPLDEHHEITAHPASYAIDDEPPWSNTTLADIREVLDEVEPEFRRVYEMQVFENRSYEEIAATLRIERVTVGTRLTRARRRLRALLIRRLGQGGGP